MEPLFEGVFLAGFECSCHVLEDGRRVDIVASTRHDELAFADYRRLRRVGITASRDGVSWVHAEKRPFEYDFSSAAPVLRAAVEHGVQVIWDLMHFGWPPHIDVFGADFPRRFARYARAFSRWLRAESDGPVMITPINEISFLAWAGGDVGCMNPFARARGVELKVQLVRATIEAIDAVRDVLPAVRFLQSEPLIHIVRPEHQPKTWRRVECDNLLQYQAWDMLAGRVFPWLGGNERYLDVLGVNFYPDNQFMLDGTTVVCGEPGYRAFSDMLVEAWRRYERPLIVSETGAEGEQRAPWLRYVCTECVTALEQGCELHGVTLYPVLDHPGWVDDRRCENGLWGYAGARGERAVHVPLLRELRLQAPRLARARERMLARGANVSVSA